MNGQVLHLWANNSIKWAAALTLVSLYTWEPNYPTKKWGKAALPVPSLSLSPSTLKKGEDLHTVAMDFACL